MTIKSKIKIWITAFLALCIIISMLSGFFVLTLSNAEAFEGNDLCVHHPEHTEDCGYMEGEEGSRCGYFCEICDYIVAEWEWVDLYELLQPGKNHNYKNVSWTMTVPESTEEILQVVLPRQIAATTLTGERIAMPITWDLEAAQQNDSESGKAQNAYVYTAALPEGYSLYEKAEPLKVLVQEAPSSSTISNVADALEVDSSENKEMHFIIRHWHSEKVDGTKYQGDNTQQANGRYFVVAEGYIVPEGDSYGFYFVYQSDTVDENGIIHKAGDREKVEEIDNVVKNSDYIYDIDPENGIIILSSNPVSDEDDNMRERFSGFSVSAGHNTVKCDNDSGLITIKYDPYVHLVKGHVFYIREADAKLATNDVTVFPADVLGEQTDKEIDTAYAYVYTEDWNGHLKGEIVKYIDENGDEKACSERSQFPEGADDHVKWTKVYSTHEGLHTDKTAFATRDDRVFDLELEAWYNEGYPSQVGMVLDASGSMAFTSESLDPINVNMLSPDAQMLLSNKIGAMENATNYGYTGVEVDIAYPRREYMIGQYTFDDESNLLLNNVTGGRSSLVMQNMRGGDTAISGSFSFYNSGTPLITDNIIDKSNGFHLNQNSGAEYALVLDAVPYGSFTLCFTVTPSRDDTLSNSAEILYVGSDYVTFGSSNYLRAGRPYDNNTFLFTKLGSEAIYSNSGGRVSAIGNIFRDSDKKFVAYVFTQTGIGTYSVKQYVYRTAANMSLGTATFTANLSTPYNRIVFNPFVDNYNGPDMYVDDIIVYNTVLSEDDILQVRSSVIADRKYSEQAVLVHSDSNIFLTNDELKLLMDPHLTDNSRLGVSGYSFYVYVPGSEILEYAPLGYWDGTYDITTTDGYPVALTADGKHVIGNVRNGGTDPGWYYVTHGGWDNYQNTDLLTSKQLMSLPIGETVQELVYLPGSKKSDAPGIGTGNIFSIDKSSPARFYVDEEGYLRCFFCVSNELYASYVYMLKDSDYVKTESLQRALGAFVTELSEKSPNSSVSAVRFSNIEADIENLVLLDWTTNAGESAGIMSLLRGESNSDEFEPGRSNDYEFGRNTINGNPVKQFNYGLTGGTSTWTGLQAFYTYLLPNDFKHDSDQYNDNGKKYLIIFTDGKDTDRTNEYYSSEAKSIVDSLKANGYTIFTVMLAGGPVVPGNSDYEVAKEFLISLASVDERGNPYYYSTTDYPTVSGNSADVLTSIFTEKILEEIVDDLTEYTVTDYIDPRFDLVDGDGNVWHLNAGGKVVINDGTITFNADTAHTYSITLSSDNNEEARKPYLCYDANNDMYYLDWVDQVIPTSSVGTDLQRVWKSKITVRAKDDFIGGNAVLSNGNGGSQNYVHSPYDDRISSGTDDMYRRSGTLGQALQSDDYPSKGFPRTTVNVGPAYTDAHGKQTIYEGESLTAESVAEKIINLLFEAPDEELTQEERLVRYYWEYLYRYAKANDIPFEKLFEKIKEAGDSGLTIDYMYLDNDYLSGGKTTQTGIDEHRADVLGTLTYTWTEVVAGFANYPDTQDGITEDNLSRKSSMSVFYTPTSVENRITGEYNADLVVEELSYAWDRYYKPVVGGEAKTTDTTTATYQTDIVSGEIILQMIVSKDVREVIKEIGETITYSADLMRTYDGKTVKVGTFTATYAYDPSDDGDVTVTATLKLEKEYEEYVTKYGLPIGTYTLENEIKNSGAASVKFLGLENVVINSTNEGLFVVNPIESHNQENASEYPAQYDYRIAYLGTAQDTHEDKSYLEDLYALFRIELKTFSSIKVKKQVAPDNGEKFGFTVTLNDPNLDPSAFTVTDQDDKSVELEWTLENGAWTARFELGNEEWIEIDGIPGGVIYTVHETDNGTDPLYSLVSVTTTDTAATKDDEGGQGETAPGKHWEWTFINSTVSFVELPETGGIGTTPFHIAGCLLLFGVAGVLFLRKRKETIDSLA